MTFARRWPLRACALVALSVACAPGREDTHHPLARAASAIQGGSADTAGSFAVAVLDGNETCSGTLLAPNLVLTARHCVSSDSGGLFVDCATDEFTETRDPSPYRISTTANAKPANAPYGVSKILVPKGAKFCGNDLALLILDATIPESEATPAIPALDPNDNDYGTTFTAIGYGTSAPGESDDGSRRRRSGIAIVCVPNDGSGCDPSDYDMVATEIAAGDGLCEGDSGSGAFVSKTLTAGPPQVFGVMSRGSDDGDTCTGAIYTRTAAFSELLISVALEAAKAGGYAPPTWTETRAAPAKDDAPPPRAPEEPEPETEASPTVASDTRAADAGCGASGRRSNGASGLAVVALAALAVGARRRRRT